MNPQTSPRRVLERIARCDPGAFEECIDSYGSLIRSLARRFTRTTADAEDAAQEINLSIWQNAGRFDPAVGTEKTFISMLARRRLIDGIRRRLAQPATVSLTPELGETLPAGSDASTAQASSDCERALQAIMLLRPHYRQVMSLAFAHGLSNSEIAARLQMPIGTIKSSMRRSLIEIRFVLLCPAPAPVSNPRHSLRKQRSLRVAQPIRSGCAGGVLSPALSLAPLGAVIDVAPACGIASGWPLTVKL